MQFPAYENRQYEPETASRPNFWNQATIGGSVGSSGQRGAGRSPSSVPFNLLDRADALYYYQNNTLISGAVNQLISEILKGGFEITVKASGRTLEFGPENEEHARYYTEVLMPGVKQVIFEWILYGYSRVRILKPRKKDNYEFPVFVIMREGTTCETIVWKNDRRSYQMTYGLTFQGENAGQKVPGGTILVFDAPFDSGRLNSRVVRAFTPLRQIKQVMHNYMDSSFYNAHPPYVITPEPDKTRQRAEDEFRMVEHAEGIVEGTEEARQKYRQKIRVETIEEDRIMSIHSNPEMANSSSGAIRARTMVPRGNPALYMGGGELFDLDSLASTASVMVQEPWFHGVTLPRGHRMNTVPSSRAPEQALMMIEKFEREAVRAIGIPPGMLEGGNSQRHAASVEMSNKELATNVTLFHRQAEILFRELMTQLFRQTINESILDSAVENDRSKDADFMREQLNSVSVSFKFLFNPTISLESLMLLHTQGIITSEAMRDVGLMLFGMPDNYGEPNPDEALANRQEQIITAESKGKLVLEKAKQQQKATATKQKIPGAGKRKSETTASEGSKKQK